MLRTLGWCWEVWGRVPWPDPILVLHSFLWRVDFKAASEDHRLLGGGEHRAVVVVQVRGEGGGVERILLLARGCQQCREGPQHPSRSLAVSRLALLQLHCVPRELEPLHSVPYRASGPH